MCLSKCGGVVEERVFFTSKHALCIQRFLHDTSPVHHFSQRRLNEIDLDMSLVRASERQERGDQKPIGSNDVGYIYNLFISKVQKYTHARRLKAHIPLLSTIPPSSLRSCTALDIYLTLDSRLYT